MVQDENTGTSQLPSESKCVWTQLLNLMNCKQLRLPPCSQQPTKRCQPETSLLSTTYRQLSRSQPAECWPRCDRQRRREASSQLRTRMHACLRAWQVQRLQAAATGSSYRQQLRRQLCVARSFCTCRGYLAPPGQSPS